MEKEKDTESGDGRKESLSLTYPYFPNNLERVAGEGN